MQATVRIEGLRELEAELDRLEKLATRKAVARRVLKREAEPMAAIMRALAPSDPTSPGDLRGSIAVGTKLSGRQARLHRKMFRDDRAAVEMFVGAGSDPAAWNQEFGNVNHGPQSFARPAWDQDRQPFFGRLGAAMWDEIRRTVARAQARAARLAARG